MDGKRALVAIGAIVGVAAGARGAAAQTPADTKTATRPAAADNYDEQFARFLREARSTAPRPVDSWGWMTGLSLDARARRVNDLLTIRVVESIAASGTADSALAKTSDAKRKLTRLEQSGRSTFMSMAVMVHALSVPRQAGSGPLPRIGLSG